MRSTRATAAIARLNARSAGHHYTMALTGSGLFIINPPWTLAAALEDSLPWLVRALGQSADAHYHLEHVEAKPGT